MRIYDFDGTIYNGDSGVDFIKFSFLRKPFQVTNCIIKTFFKFLKYKRGKIEFKEVKETLFSFVKNINNLDNYIAKFIQKNKSKIKEFYLKQKNKNDVIITASLDFYIKPLCHSVGIKKVIATKYDVSNGKIIGSNCRGKYKEEVILKRFNKMNIDAVYTDSIMDEPMFKYASDVYIVNKNKIEKYTENYKFNKNIFDLDFLLFILCGALGTLSNFICSSIISIRINPIISYIFGYSISLVVSYLLNVTFIFRRKIKIIDFIKFVISYLPNFIILFSFVYIFIDILNFNKYLTYLMAAIIGLPITFIILKLLTFKKK